MAVKFQDFSFEVKAALNDTSIGWLYEWAETIKSYAQRNCSTDQEYSSQLSDSYGYVVDETKGDAIIGSPLEQAFWEEFGTGAYADTSKNGGRKGRQGWWIYTPGSKGPEGRESNHYATKEDAESMAAYIRDVYGKEAVVTNGRKPNHTLEKAFTVNKARAKADLDRKMKERMNK